MDKHALHGGGNNINHIPIKNVLPIFRVISVGCGFGMLL